MVEAAAACPACGALLAKRPQRKTKCWHCGEVICVKSTPEHPEKRLMTVAQAEEAEAAWRRRALARQAYWISREFGLPEAVIRLELERATNTAAAMRSLLTPLALSRDRHAVLSMMRYASDDDDFRRWHRVFTEIDMEKYKREGYASLQLFLGRSPGCPECRSRDLAVVAVDAPLDPAFNARCPRVNGSPAQICYLMISPLIRQADGKVRVEYLDGTSRVSDGWAD